MTVDQSGEFTVHDSPIDHVRAPSGLAGACDPELGNLLCPMYRPLEISEEHTGDLIPAPTVYQIIGNIKGNSRGIIYAKALERTKATSPFLGTIRDFSATQTQDRFRQSRPTQSPGNGKSSLIMPSVRPLAL